MAIPSAQVAAERLANGIRNGATRYTAGVNAVTVSPTIKAADSRAKWVNAMADPRTADRWENGLRDTTLAQWKTATSTIGSQRYSQSADKAQANYQEFMTKFIPYLTQVQEQVRAMPDITVEDRINRAVTNMRLLSQYTG
jgi:hypothetical protein